MKHLILLLLCCGPWLQAQSMFAQKDCPNPDQIGVYHYFQYWLTAETALRGTALWLKENPDQWTVWYGAALSPEKQSNDPLAEAARAAVLGRHGDTRVKAHLLNAKWEGKLQPGEQHWRDFLTAKEPDARLAALKQVDFSKLDVLKGEKTPINPWIYRVLERETAAVLKQMTLNVPSDDPFHATATLIATVIGTRDPSQIKALLKARTLPSLLDADKGIKHKTMQLWEMDRIPHEQTRSFFTIYDAKGFRYRLLRGEHPRPERPRGIRGDALKTWRQEEAQPFMDEFRFWEEQMALRLYQMGDHASLQRLLSNHHQLEKRDCAYQAAITFALLRYSADILNPKGHYKERNYLKEQGFNGYQLLFQLEIEPTHGSSTF